MIENIATLKDSRTRRVSSYDRLGGNLDRITIGAKEVVDIANISGCGIIRHFWFTLTSPDQMIFRNLVLRVYWDGEDHPSVEAPIGDFFGQGWGESYAYAALPVCASPKRSGNIYFPMPFSTGAIFTLSNESEHQCTLYYYIDYEEVESTEGQGHFHASWRRNLNFRRRTAIFRIRKPPT